MARSNLAVGLLAIGMASASAAGAATVAYTNFADWNTAVGGTVTTVSIPDVGAFQFFGTGDASVTYSGVVFSQSKLLGTSSLFNFSPGLTGLPAILTSQPAAGVKTNNIQVTLPFTVKAFALLFGTLDGSSVDFKLSNGDAFSRSTAASGYATPNFFGVVSTTAFDTILATSTDSSLNIREIQHGESANTGVIPEPGAWITLGSGLLLLVTFGRRR